MIAALFANQAVRKAAIIAAMCAGLFFLLIWQRSDAVSDYKTDLRATSAEQRLQNIKRAQETRDDVQSLDDCTLLDRLLGRVRGGNQPDRPAILGCGDASAPEPPGDDPLPSIQ